MVWHTLAALVDRGVEITFVAPADEGTDVDAVAREMRALCHPHLVTASRRSLARAVVIALIQNAPTSIVRHRLRSVRDRVRELLSSEPFDLIHAEQLQAMANCTGDVTSEALVLRAQNVESELWRRLAALRPMLRAPLLREARLVREWECRAVRRSDATIALTTRDAAYLAAIANEPEKVHRVPAAFPAEVQNSPSPSLPGAPAVVLFGSAGWLPNADGARWFLRQVWPVVKQRLPAAVLHVFGLASGRSRPRDVVAHPAPEYSGQVFSPGSVLVIPLRIASGVRVKVLEAWARGVPVVATPEAAEGLEATARSELFVARDGEEFAQALASLSSNPREREALVDRARALLRANHAPATTAERLLSVYERALTGRMS